MTIWTFLSFQNQAGRVPAFDHVYLARHQGVDRGLAIGMDTHSTLSTLATLPPAELRQWLGARSL